MVLKSFVPLLQQEEEEFGPKKGIHTGTHNGNKNTERKRETKMEGRHTEVTVFGRVFCLLHCSRNTLEARGNV